MPRVVAKTISELKERSLGLHTGAETLRAHVILEDRQARSTGSLMGASARGRRWAARGVVCLAVALAAWIGATLGSGAVTAEARYYSELVAAQSGQVELFGPAEVPGHPGGEGLQRQDLLRQIMALDAVN